MTTTYCIILVSAVDEENPGQTIYFDISVSDSEAMVREYEVVLHWLWYLTFEYRDFRDEP